MVINKKLGLEKQIKVLTDIKKAGTKKELENANKLSSIMADVASGNRDFSDALNEIDRRFWQTKRSCYRVW